MQMLGISVYYQEIVIGIILIIAISMTMDKEKIYYFVIEALNECGPGDKSNVIKVN